MLALGWIGASVYALTLAWPGPSLPAWIGWAGELFGAFGPGRPRLADVRPHRRRETERFTSAVTAMRGESQALETELAIGRGADRGEPGGAQRGSGAADEPRRRSLGPDRPGHRDLARESAELDRKAKALDLAAEAARIDVGVLMSDLPKAEAQARAAAEAMKQAGLAAHEQAGALESQLAALAAKGREADEVTGGAAQRLGAHVARIESGADAAAARMNEAAAQMEAAVDGSMARAAEAVDQARAGLEAQGQAMLAMVEQSKAAFEEAGAETTKRWPNGSTWPGARSRCWPGGWPARTRRAAPCSAA